jgi:membrane protease YdiL (CAAX protease family)
VCQELFGSIPSWLAAAQAGVVVGFIVVALAAPRLRPLWRFGVTAGALLLFTWTAGAVSLEIPGVLPMPGATPFDARMQAEQLEKLALALAMIGVLLLLRRRPRDFFLTRGDLTAPIRPVPLLGFPKPDSWRRFGLIWGFGIAAALAVVQWLLLRPTPSALVALLPVVPGILLYAALNAFSEEMAYRAPMLATLEAAVGGRNALWQSAVFFGVAHYFGIPGGLIGALLSIFMGWMLSKAMLETRGLFWAWWIHFLSDVVIFTFVALALTA